MTLRFIPILAILATCAFGQAQPLKTRILTLALDGKINAFFMNAGKVEPFTAERSGLGSPFAYTGSSQFLLRAQQDDFAADPLPAPLASVALPRQSKLILLTAQSAADQKIKLNAYDISAAGFRPGDYRVFNFSDRNLLLILGKSKFALRPGDDKIVSNAILRDNTLDLVIRIAKIEGGKPKQVYASAWGHQPVKRHFVFLFNGSHHTRPIAIRRFADYAK
jgi:hypothetical protein